MAAIKNYTSLEQSKVLSKILPLKSADMYYSHEFVNSAGDYYKINIASEGYFDDVELLGSDVPAWSLASLLDVLPVGTESHKQTDGSISYYHVEVYNNKKYFSTKRYDNLIDACYEMILKLRELKIL